MTDDWLDKHRGKVFGGEWPTIPQIFFYNAERVPDRRCFEIFYPEHEVFTYAEAAALVRKIALKMKSAGLKSGDRVALCGKNSPEWAICYLAILSAGCVVAPLDVLLSTEEISNLAKFAGLKAAFYDIGKGECFSGVSMEFSALLEKDGADELPYALDWAADVGDAELELPANCSDTAAMLFTSGTTGFPKGVMLSHSNFLSDVNLSNKIIRLDSSSVFYAILPMHHAYTMVASFLSAMSFGSTLVFGRRLMSAYIADDLRRGKVTVFVGVPLLYIKIAKGLLNGIRKKGKGVWLASRFVMTFGGFLKKHFGINVPRRFFRAVLEKIAFDGIDLCICGGGPLPAETFRHYNQLGFDFVQGYGMTETSPIIALSPRVGYDERSVGKILPLVKTRLKDVAGGNGTLCVKGSIVMKGYYNNPGATSAAIDAEGYMDTGDVGHLNGKGFLFLTGRAKNIIVTPGGKNVFPEEIEDEFRRYEDEVEQIMVAGVKGADGFEVITAVMHPSRECEKKASGDYAAIERRFREIVSAVNGKLPAYKRIVSVIVDKTPLEMTSLKKVKRGEVLDRLKKDGVLGA